MYEIYAYGDNDMLYGIFNAVAAIVSSESFKAALAMVAVCGVLAATLVYATAPQRMGGWKWLLTVLGVYSCLLVPKVTVGIVDKLGNQPVMVIQNIPVGLGLFAGLSSLVGNIMTEVFEGALQILPGPAQLSPELTYQQHGVLFGNTLVKRVREAQFTDAAFRTDVINFLANCTQYDLSDGSMDPAAFEGSTNLWAIIANTNPARFSSITAPQGTSVLMPCTQAYLNLDQRRPQVLAAMYNAIAAQLNPDIPAVQAQTLAANQITTAAQRTQLADAASDASAILLQNAMINAVNDASGIMGQRIDDPASLLLAFGRAQSTVQTNAAWLNSGRMAEEALPLIRNAIEAIVYALFPIVVLMMLTTHGQTTARLFQSYILVMLWIQMWPVVYAVLNYMATLASAKHIAAAASIPGLGTSGMTLATAQLVYSNALSDAAVVGYLVTAVPVMAWAAVKSMEGVTQAVFGAGASLVHATSAASASDAIGNASAGNVGFDQQSIAPTTSSAYYRTRQDDVTGHIHGWNVLSGTGNVHLLQNSGYVSRQISSRESSASEESATKAVESARTEVVSAMQERAAMLADAVVHGRSSMDTSRLGSGYSKQQLADMQQNVQDVNSIISSVARNTQKGENVVANLIFAAALEGGGHLNLGASNNVNLGEVVSQSTGGTGKSSTGVSGADMLSSLAGGGVSAGLNATAMQQQTYASHVDRSYAEVKNNLSQDQLTRVKSFADHYVHDENFQHALATDDRDAEDRSARMSQNVAHMERAEAALSERENFVEGLRFGKGDDDVISVDILRDPHYRAVLMKNLQHYAGSPRAALAATHSELAAESLMTHPTTYLDGTTAKWGDGAVRADHEAATHGAQYTPNIAGTYREFKEATGVHMQDPVDAGKLPEDVQGAIGANRSDALGREQHHDVASKAAQGKFQTVSGLVETPPEVDSKGVGNPDGRLVTKRILANDAGDLFVQDAKQSVENNFDRAVDLAREAKEVGEKALEKAKRLIK